MSPLSTPVSPGTSPNTTRAHPGPSDSPRRDALTAAMLEIVAEQGLDRLSVRETATRAGVSIGTVQHYFATKDAMLAGAFAEVVRRVRARLDAVPYDADTRTNLARALGELLPLDELRTTEVRVQVAFSARATTSPELAALQRTTLTGILAELTTALKGHGQPAERAALSAQVALAAVDGLALHAVSAGTSVDAVALTAALDRLLDAVVD